MTDLSAMRINVRDLVCFGIIIFSVLIARLVYDGLSQLVGFVLFLILFLLPGIAKMYRHYKSRHYIEEWLNDKNYKEVHIGYVNLKMTPFRKVSNYQVWYRVTAQDTERKEQELFFLFGSWFWGCLSSIVRVECS